MVPGYPRSKFPVIRDSTDPKADVRKRLGVSIVPGTFLIHVSFSSPDALEAAEVVNQVVSAFEQQNKDFNVGMNSVFRTNYESYLKKLNQDISGKQNEIITLAERLERQASKSADTAEKSRSEERDFARPKSRADRTQNLVHS